MKVLIPYDNCVVEVTGEYHPPEYEDGFLFMGAEFYVEDFTLNYMDSYGVKISLDDLPVGMVDSKFFDELEQRCIDKVQQEG